MGNIIPKTNEEEDDMSFGFSHEEATSTVMNNDEAVKLMTDLANALHTIASNSNEASTVRVALNALIRNDITITDELS